MAGLFTGSPQTATSYVTSSTEVPKWMQDAIYNQIQLATNTANTPFSPYTAPMTAELSPLQQQAYQQVQSNVGTWKPAIQTAQTGLTDLSTAAGGMSAAQPYLQGAAAPSYAGVANYMNPYNEAVTSRIAQLGARNLQENLLPNVSDTFIRAGQFGSGRMGEFGSRALRDTQEAILGQQAQALQAGYGQALGAAQSDAARQAQLASTAGGLTQADLAQKQAALTQLAQTAQQQQGMGATDVAALEAAGSAQQALEQKKLDTAYAQRQLELQYPKSQLDWLNAQIRGMASNVPTATTQSGTSTGQTYTASPLSQLAAGLATYKGLSSLMGG